jgi:hypothetical protein
MDAASPGASRRPWPSPVFARLGSPLLPLRGLPCRRGRLHVMLRTGELLDPLKGLCHGASPVGSRLAAAVSYRAAWSLPGPGFHRLVSVLLREHPFPQIHLLPLVARYWARPKRGNLNTSTGPPAYLRRRCRRMTLRHGSVWVYVCDRDRRQRRLDTRGGEACGLSCSLVCS